MTIIHSLPAMLAAAQAARGAGRRVGLVPTMGYLHEGHLSLVREARSRSDIVVMSIFVNPTQFAPTDDLERYPRDLPRDTSLAEEAGVDILFVPEVSEMYPAGFGTSVDPGPLGSVLEGASRPGHFAGVLTVVAKLFHQTLPNVAVFGQKDFQQALLIRRMVRDLDFDLALIVAPIVREPDGLAMSSRNVYLTPNQRVQARGLSESLTIALGMIRSGERSAEAVSRAMRARIGREPETAIDYVAIADTQTLKPVAQLQTGVEIVIALAVKVGTTRLLDNALIVP